MVVSTLSISILYFLMMCSGAPGQMTFFWAVRSHNREFHLLKVFDGDVEQRALYLQHVGDGALGGARECGAPIFKERATAQILAVKLDRVER